jgi:hypothetical protein
MALSRLNSIGAVKTMTPVPMVGLAGSSTRNIAVSTFENLCLAKFPLPLCPAPFTQWIVPLLKGKRKIGSSPSFQKLGQNQDSRLFVQGVVVGPALGALIRGGTDILIDLATSDLTAAPHVLIVDLST